MESERKFNVQLQHYILLFGMIILIAWFVHIELILPLCRSILHGLLGADLKVTTMWSDWSFAMNEEQTIFINPIFAFGYIDLFIGILFGLFISLILPESIGFMKVKVLREIDVVRKRLKAQTGIASDAELNQWFTWSNADIEAEGERRNYQLVVVREMIDGRNAIEWSKRNIGGQLWFFPAIRLYMTHHFTEHYANMVQGAAYIGAANLIIFIGIRGIKFIPPERPSAILFALWVEMSMLIMLGVTLAYTEEEERLDKILKELKDRTSEQAQRMVTLNEQSSLQTQALGNLVRILSGVNTDDVSKNANNRAGELLSRAMAEGRVDKAVKDAADQALGEAYTARKKD
ncbi:MAG TPA: hypothetical protein VFJ29_03745 [Candidatus Kapabacteria bacterium]|nr:hypothetical protein [Candidatus Kapabacteria bacterium]